MGLYILIEETIKNKNEKVLSILSFKTKLRSAVTMKMENMLCIEHCKQTSIITKVLD